MALQTFKTIDDEDPALIWWRSICNFALGDFENALSDSEALLEYETYAALACLSIALVRATAPHDDLRDAELAFHYMNRFVATYDGEITWRILSIRAAVDAERNDFEQAVKHSQKNVPEVCSGTSRLRDASRACLNIPEPYPSIHDSNQSNIRRAFSPEVHCRQMLRYQHFLRADFKGQKLPYAVIAIGAPPKTRDNQQGFCFATFGVRERGFADWCGAESDHG